MMGVRASRPVESVATTSLGLFLALLGPPLVAFAFRHATPGKLVPSLAGQFCLVLVALAVAFIVRFWERRPLAILGLRRPHASSFGWAALLAVAYFFVATPVMYAALSFLGWRSFEPTVPDRTG
jgi:hypothetical protein